MTNPNNFCWQNLYLFEFQIEKLRTQAEEQEANLLAQEEEVHGKQRELDALKDEEKQLMEDIKASEKEINKFEHDLQIASEINSEVKRIHYWKCPVNLLKMSKFFQKKVYYLIYVYIKLMKWESISRNLPPFFQFLEFKNAILLSVSYFKLEIVYFTHSNDSHQFKNWQLTLLIFIMGQKMKKPSRQGLEVSEG